MIYALLAIFLIALWVYSNISIIKLLSVKEMYIELVAKQSICGRIFINIFYIPAWFYKIIHYVIICAIE